MADDTAHSCRAANDEVKASNTEHALVHMAMHSGCFLKVHMHDEESNQGRQAYRQCQAASEPMHDPQTVS